MKNLFSLYSEEELEVRNENLEENIDAKDELISDVNVLDSNFDEALLFFCLFLHIRHRLQGIDQVNRHPPI